MKAVRVNEFGPPSVCRIEEIPTPTPEPTEVLVSTRFASLNFPDILKLTGGHQNKETFPYTPGIELSGVIDAVGDEVTGYSVGDRVFARVGRGAFAEAVAVHTTSLRKIPDFMSDEDAAAFSVVYLTSHIGLVHRGNMKEGECVLVHSAAGGTGISAVQIAKALGAHPIIGTVGDDSKMEAVRKAGADYVLNYETEDFISLVKEVTDGKGADIIYDPVGGDLTEKSTKCIASEGRLLIIGFTSGVLPKLRTNHMLVKNYSVIGFYIASTPPPIVEDSWEKLLGLYAENNVRPIIDSIYPMERLVDAMTYMQDRKVAGKILLHW